MKKGATMENQSAARQGAARSFSFCIAFGSEKAGEGRRLSNSARRPIGDPTGAPTRLQSSSREVSAMGSQQRDAKLLGGVFDLPAAFYAAAAAGTAALETQREELAGGEEGEGLITIREVAGAVAGEDGVEEESTSAR